MWWVRDEWHSVSEGFAWGAVTKPLMADWWFTSTRKNNEKKKNENDGAIPFHYYCRFFIIRQLRKLESGKKKGKKWRMRLNVESFDFQTFSRIQMIWASISRRNLFFFFSRDLSVVWHLSKAGRWRCHQRPRTTSIEYIVPQLKVTLHSDAATPPWY